jgi:DNA mismatch repair protein MSH2
MPLEEKDEKCSLGMSAVMRNDQGGKHFGVCFYNAEMKHLEVCQFLDNDFFTMLEALLLQTQPSFCWMIPPLGQIGEKVRDVFENCRVELKSARIVPSGADTEGDLQRLLKGGTKRHLAEIRQADAMKACQTIITECELLRDDDNYETMSMSAYLVDGYMRLDNAVFTALNLLPRPGEGVRTPTSLVGFLNKCRTSVGSRRLMRWVSQPLTNAKEIQARHDMVCEHLCLQKLCYNVN